MTAAVDGAPMAADNDGAPGRAVVHGRPVVVGVDAVADNDGAPGRAVVLMTAAADGERR